MPEPGTAGSALRFRDPRAMSLRAGAGAQEQIDDLACAAVSPLISTAPVRARASVRLTEQSSSSSQVRAQERRRLGNVGSDERGARHQALRSGLAAPGSSARLRG